MLNSPSPTPAVPALRPASRWWQGLRLVPLGSMLLAVSVLLAAFSLGGMPKIAAWYLVELIPPALGLVSLIVTGLYGWRKRKFNRLMALTLGMALLSLLPLTALVIPVPFPASRASASPAATVRLPANEALKVAWGGDALETNYHVITPDQRWAYDLFVAPYLSGSERLEDYGCYGIPVVAPIAGLVTQAHDGEPDQTPGIPSNNYTAPTGNFVVFQLETGTYLIIAHLKQGSLLVASGQTVTEGQPIGQCGNSGNTSEPHIHIHHQRQDPAVFPLNFAEGLPLYFRDHDGAPMPVGGFKIEGEKATALGDTVQHIGK